MERIESTFEGGGYFPLLLVTLILNGRRSQVRGLLDSGTDATHIPSHVAEAHGIDPAALPVVGDVMGTSIGGEFELRTVEATIQFGDVSWTGTAFVTSGNKQALVLGRNFFRSLSIRFEWGEDPPALYIGRVGEA